MYNLKKKTKTNFFFTSKLINNVKKMLKTTNSLNKLIKDVEINWFLTKRPNILRSLKRFFKVKRSIFDTLVKKISQKFVQVNLQMIIHFLENQSFGDILGQILK